MATRRVKRARLAARREREYQENSYEFNNALGLFRDYNSREEIKELAAIAQSGIKIVKRKGRVVHINS